ncbi:hypothetical protein [Streptomyces sp. NPDC050145]|uniref:hypothetical protein n=1 Tax=Streptomyces sp. NPDC050145 TaxID=3365602 RepID=UPI00378C2DC5
MPDVVDDGPTGLVLADEELHRLLLLRPEADDLQTGLWLLPPAGRPAMPLRIEHGHGRALGATGRRPAESGRLRLGHAHRASFLSMARLVPRL